MTGRFLAVLSLTLSLTPLSAFAGVSASFRKAKNNFDRKQFRTAFHQLETIIAKYPDHSPSHTLLGQLHYQSGRLKAAGRHFLKSKAIPDGDVAYQYGLSLYTLKQFRQAIDGFKKVPANSTYRDLAEFYAGVCLYRIRNYTGAQYFLSLAKNLPEKIEPYRQKYLQSSAQKLQIQRFSRVDRRYTTGAVAPYDPQFMRNQVVLPPILPPGPGSPYTRPHDSEETSQLAPLGFSSQFTPKLEYSRVAIDNDLHGFRSNSVLQERRNAAISLDLRYDTEFVGLTLDTDLEYLNQSSSGIDIEYTFVETDPTAITAREGTSRAPLSENDDPVQNFAAKSGILDIAPNIIIKPNRYLRLGAGYGLWQLYLNMSGQSKLQDQGPMASLDVNFDPVYLALTARLHSQSNMQGSEVSVVNEFTGNLKVELELLTFFAKSNLIQIDKPNAPSIRFFTFGFSRLVQLEAGLSFSNEFLSGSVAVDSKVRTPTQDLSNTLGSHNETGIRVALDWNLGLGFSVNGSLQADEISKYTHPVKQSETAEELAIATAEGSRVISYFGMRLSPIDWFYLNGGVRMTETDYSVDPSSGLTQSFQRTVPSSTIESNWTVGVTTSF